MPLAPSDAARTRQRVQELLRQVVEPAVFDPRVPVAITACHLDSEPLSYDEAIAGRFVPFTLDAPWGPPWGTTWFRLRGRVPEGWAGQEVVLRFELAYCADGQAGGEALVWRDGVPVQGLSPEHRHAVLLKSAVGGEEIDLYVEAAANPRVPTAMSGVTWPLLLPDPASEPAFVLTRCELAVRNADAYALACDLRTALDLSVQLAKVQDRRAEVDEALARACDATAVGASAAARRALIPVLAPPPVAGGSPRHRITAVGHAHIDTAWLWPARETVRKCARTFASALALMDDYADYHFVCSAARHLSWIEEQYPGLFARIVERVRGGQFEPVGGMWVEADCNLPSGESLVRQIVHGKRWFLEHLGWECTELWLPDAFGYTASLPQIMAEAGARWFVSQKLSWNDTNAFPYHTFWWEGIDGTRVRAHFPPAATYSGVMTMAELQRSASGGGARSLYPYGHGDGGGGPTQDMIEAARRFADLADVPHVALEPAAAFFAANEADPTALPVWAGDLYLEKHRGTYTSQAAIKRANRKGEVLLGEAELWSTVRPDGSPYPSDALDRAWKLLLVNQFHDILPGSSIRWVYDDARRDYVELAEIARPVVESAASAIAEAVDTTGLADPVVVLNPTSFPRTEVVTSDGTSFLVDVPPLGYATFDLRSPSSAAGVEVGEGWLTNGHLRVSWDGQGRLTLWDLDNGREVLAPGRPGNVFQLHHDQPREWDAWDVDRSYLDHVEDLAGLTSVEARATVGGLRAEVRFRHRFGSSTIDQTMVLAAGSRRLDFVTQVDWHEDHKFLKVAFPVSVRAPHATYEIQFGHIERPTHENTSWERARFEVCAQRWADLSEAEYGVALLNDCKYGYDVRGDVLRLSLLRAPTAPDPSCDRGRHDFTYSLLPHTGGVGHGGVISAGYALNAPLRVVPTGVHSGPLPVSMSFVSVDSPGFVVETVKRADDGAGVIVRGYEAFGGHRTVRMSTALGLTHASRCDLLERDREDIRVEEGGLTLRLRPFELVTLRLTRGPAAASGQKQHACHGVTARTEAASSVNR